MNKKSVLFLKYIFSIVFVIPAFFFIFEGILLNDNTAALAGLKNQNQRNDLHSSLDEDEDHDESIFPTNPMELINVLRNIEAMNERTDPSDAIDNALKAFEDQDEEDFSFDKERIGE